MALGTIGTAVAVSLFPRTGQPEWYHDFADKRAWLGIANFGDVVSNLPFATVGAVGIWFLCSERGRAAFQERREGWPYFTAFVGLMLTAFGSAYYHLAPNNARLVWDRIPMTIVFLSVVATVITERIDVRAGLAMLPVLLGLGAWSVLAWYRSELAGAGDLRFYAAIQLYAGVVLLLACWMPSRYTRGSDLLMVGGFYVLAKLLEIFDRQIFGLSGVVSGHTLKHLAGAAAGYWILKMLRKREVFVPVDLTEEDLLGERAVFRFRKS